jgi:hypothetical protein
MDSVASGSPKLRHLVVGFCSGLTPRALEAIAQCCPAMEHLDLSSCSNAVTDHGITVCNTNTSPVRPGPGWRLASRWTRPRENKEPVGINNTPPNGMCAAGAGHAGRAARDPGGAGAAQLLPH